MKIDWRIIKRWATATASIQEKKEVETWGRENEQNRNFLKDTFAYYRQEGMIENPSPEDIKRVWKKLDPYRRARIVWIKRLSAVAASILIGWGIFIGNKLSQQETEKINPMQTSVRLITANGKRYELNKETCITSLIAPLPPHTTNSSSDSNEETTEHYNEIIVPRCGHYMLTLPDGSRIYMNAESTLRFPSRFGKERRVYLSGEAYFEVERDTLHPFWVEYENTCLQVLGTKFNIKAYPSTPSFTTLSSGCIRISHAKQTLTLKPGEQCEINTEGTQLHHPDLMTVLAWKNGEFIFKDTTLEDIMHELARWYDMKVEYETEELKKMQFYLYVERSGTLSEVLDKMALTNRIKYRIDGNKITLKKR